LEETSKSAQFIFTTYLKTYPSLPLTAQHSQFDAQGPIKGSIDTVIMHRDMEGNLLCYQVPKKLEIACHNMLITL
jgi:hypothetical protein